MINYESDKNFRAAMNHATETPERNLAPEPNEQGFRYILNWMKFILEKPCDRTADESFITEWCDFVYQCQSRLAAAEEDVAERDRWLYASKVRENDYHERWLHNLDRATGMASKWGDLENRVFAAEQRADAAESALQSAWGEAREAAAKVCDALSERCHLAASVYTQQTDGEGTNLWEHASENYKDAAKQIRALPAPSKAAPEPVNAASQVVGIDASSQNDSEPAGAAPLAEQRDGVNHPTYGSMRNLLDALQIQMRSGEWPRIGQMGALYWFADQLRSTAVQLRADGVEPFVVKHYGSEAHPSLKGNGFDGLVLGENREEAQDFVDWINTHIAASPAAAKEWAYDEHCWSGNTKVGDEVVFMAKNGWPGEAERASNDLTKDEKYIVTDVIDHGDSTDIYLAGFDRPFNSVMFRHAHPPTGDRHE